VKALSQWQTTLLRGAGSFVAAGGPHASLLVLIYHRVLATPDPLLPTEPSAAEFAAQMDLVKSLCHVLPLGEAIERLLSGTLPPRALCVTFDDGYANNRSVAAPILAQRRLPATVFVATGFIGRGRMWNDTVIESVRRAGAELDLARLGLGCYRLSDDVSKRRAIDEILGALRYKEFETRRAAVATIAECVGHALPNDLMMTEQHIKELPSFGIEVGAHTIEHPILAQIDGERAWQEVAGSKAVLEEITGRQVSMFAYPNGRPRRDYDRSHVEMVRKAGFEAAVSTAWGAAGPRADRHQIPRSRPWEKSPLRFAARLLATYRQQQVATA
jgi:peptidoglycan/xylan/chitin deacetylase (PgdA/CDA1 family)